MNQFPAEIQEFGNRFVIIQRYRHYADYAPVTDFERSWVMHIVEQTEQIIIQFNSVPSGARRAFAIHVLLRTRPD